MPSALERELVAPLRATHQLLITSLLFAATAFTKLVLYISAYGFTDLRLLSA